MKASALAAWKRLRSAGWTKLPCRLRAYWKAHWTKRRTDRLRLVDSLGLGERRSVAVLEVEGRRFLIGATQHAVTLLGELRPCARAFEKVEAAQGAETLAQEVAQEKENAA